MLPKISPKFNFTLSRIFIQHEFWRAVTDNSVVSRLFSPISRDSCRSSFCSSEERSNAAARVTYLSARRDQNSQQE